MLHEFRERIHHVPRELGIHDQRDFIGRLPDAQRELRLEFRIHGDRAQSAGFVLKWLGELRPERAAGMLGKFVGIFRERRVVAHLFQDAGEIADGNAFREQVLQNALHLAEAQLCRDQFIHHRRVRLLQIVNQRLHVLPRQNFVAMPAHRFRQMGDQHRRRVHDGEPGQLGILTLHIRHPSGGQLINRLDGRDALEHRLAVGRIHRQPVLRHELALRDGIALQYEPVFVRAKLQIVAQLDRRQQHAHLGGKISPHARDARQQIAAFFVSASTTKP